MATSDDTTTNDIREQIHAITGHLHWVKYVARKPSGHDDPEVIEADDKLLALTQRIALEARIDEWMQYHRFSSNLLDDGTSGYQLQRYLKDHPNELKSQLQELDKK